MKKLIFGIIFLMIAVPMVYATGDKLLIDNLDVKVDDRWSRNVDDGETITREAAPGSTVDFKIKFKNNFTDEEDLKIEGITATVTIGEIDDGEDIDEESNEFDVRANDDKTVTISFKIPVEVDEDTYDVTIEAEGEDENGTDQSVTWNVDLEVKKENHELRFYKMTLSPTEVKAGSSASLTLGIMNTGSEDEEDVELQISNSDLEYDNVVTISELTAEPYEDASKYLKTFKIEVPKTAEPGIYPISIKVTYDEGDESLPEETIDLTVTEAALVEEEIPEEEEKGEEVVVVTQPTTTVPTTGAVITQPTITPPTTVTEEKSFFETGWFIGVLIGAEILVIIIAILLVMALVRRKE